LAVSPIAENFNSRAQGFVGAIVLLLLAIGARRLAPTFRRGLVVGAAALAVAWRVPPFEQIFARLPLWSLGARQYWAVVFVLFASAAAGPAVFDAATRVARPWAAALALAGLMLLGAGLLPSLPSARGRLVASGQQAIDALRARGKLPHASSVYRDRLERYLHEGRRTALIRLAIPGACWMVAGWALWSVVPRRRVLVAAVLCEIAAFGIGYMPAVSIQGRMDPALAIRDVKRLDPESRSMIASSGDAYPANLATLDGVHDVVSFDVLESRQRAENLRACGYEEGPRAFGAASKASCLADLGVRYFLSREPLAGTARVGGSRPPAVGVYEIPNVRPAVRAANAAPKGFAAGALVSLVAAVGSVLLIAASIQPRSCS
jgi:hypothetical protein